MESTQKSTGYPAPPENKMYPSIDLVESLIAFSTCHCNTSFQHGWETRLNKMPIGSNKVFCYSLRMSIAPQGTGDVIVVPRHVNSIIDHFGMRMHLEWLQDPVFVSTKLSRTSVWVKSNVAVMKNSTIHMYCEVWQYTFWILTTTVDSSWSVRKPHLYCFGDGERRRLYAYQLIFML